jgi:hypothetical protein
MKDVRVRRYVFQLCDCGRSCLHGHFWWKGECRSGAVYSQEGAEVFIRTIRQMRLLAEKNEEALREAIAVLPKAFEEMQDVEVLLN